jgi:hypothetical protein
MYVRTTYAIGDPAQIEHAIEGLRTEAPKLLADCPGYRSFGLFADRELGKIAMGSWWETEADRTNSDAHLGERRAELLTPFADSVLIGNFEVAAYAATPELESAGAFRLGRFLLDPSRIDDMVNAFKEVGLPRMHDLSGFCGAALFIDRALSMGSVSTLFADRAAIAASRTPQSAMRREAVQRTGMRVVCMEEFEVVLLENSPDAAL